MDGKVTIFCPICRGGISASYYLYYCKKITFHAVWVNDKVLIVQAFAVGLLSEEHYTDNANIC